MKRYNITVNGKAYDVQVDELGAGAPPAPPAPAASPAPAPAAAAPAPKPPVAPAGSTDVLAPMPGNILDVKVKEGDSIKEGDLVLMLEAMKMENEIFANATGKVVAVHVKKGETVNSNDALISIA